MTTKSTARNFPVISQQQGAYFLLLCAGFHEMPTKTNITVNHAG
jgi:hypothetical protein